MGQSLKLFDDSSKESKSDSLKLFDDTSNESDEPKGFLDRTAELLKTFEKNHPTISKIGHRLLDVSYKTPEELESYKQSHNGEAPPKIVTGMEGSSLLPHAEHQDDESWTSYLTKGLYNTLIEPLGTGPGFIGAASLRSPKIGNVSPVAKDVKPLTRIAKSAPERKLLNAAEGNEILPVNPVKPSFIAGSEGVAKNEPYTIDLGGINPAIGAKNQGTILPREVEGLSNISPDLAARRGLGVGKPLTDIDVIRQSEPELASKLEQLNKAKGNIGDSSAPYQLPSVSKDVIDIPKSDYTVENPNRNMGAGVKSITRPGKALDEINKVNFPGITPVKEVPNPGKSQSEDVSAFRAEYGSADKTLLSRPETAPIAKALTTAEDSKLKFIATSEREFAEHVKGLDKNDRILLGKALDGQDVALTPELANKVVELRAKLDEIFKQVPDLKSSRRYITDYLTHIAKEGDEDLASGLKQVWEFHLKKPFKDFFGGEPLATKSTGVGDINETGLGSPDSPFVKERKGVLNDLEYDVNKIFPAYIESIAKNIFDKPAVKAAKDALARVPDKNASGEALRLKELAQWYIKNYTRYDSAPGLEQAWSNWGSRLRRTANRSMLGLSTGLQSLHAARVAANLYPELPGKYLMKGMLELAKNPAKAYSETAALGFLQGELRPWQFKTPMQKMDSILQFGSAADFLDKSIGYHGFKQMFLGHGMTAEQASSAAIAASKKASLTSSPARGIKGFSREANFAGGELGQFAMMYKQVPTRIVEQVVQIAADAKANPAKFRRMITGLGIAVAGSEAGIKTFHVSPKSLLPDLGGGPVVSNAYRIWRKIYSGDAAGALKDLVLFATPAGKSLDYQLKTGPSLFENQE